MGGISVIEDYHINDYDTVKRTWRERLWSWPWRPWKKTKQVFNPKFYFIGDSHVVCSPAVAMKFRRQLANEDALKETILNQFVKRHK